ncbi:twin-arginine translocase TatA/TatE family subunit [Aciditerrimonas ferrireducens]|uniref:Twin-arginine translocase TatA/TatE family subunit n=1 Tax=Aciditerrimonas ferrireducens TaxID=667306 RepID=A0ABV6C242_9ACTN
MELDPAKILLVLVVALIVLGPDKLPKAARQMGAAWGQLRQWRARLEEEVRGAVPNLPSTATITDAVRSPLSFLDRLADEHGTGTAPAGAAGAATIDPPVPGVGATGSGTGWATPGSPSAIPGSLGTTSGPLPPTTVPPVGGPLANGEPGAGDPSMN